MFIRRCKFCVYPDWRYSWPHTTARLRHSVTNNSGLRSRANLSTNGGNLDIFHFQNHMPLSVLFFSFRSEIYNQLNLGNSIICPSLSQSDTPALSATGRAASTGRVAGQVLRKPGCQGRTQIVSYWPKWNKSDL